MKAWLLPILVLLFLLAILFPRSLPRLFRRAGRQVGDLGRMGKELATGEEIDQSPLAKYEVKAGELVAMRVLTDNPISSDAALQERVRSIGARIAEHALRRQIPYRFTVVEAKEPNAFAVPGGSVFVTRPLIDLCEDDVNALACVLGHEIIHIDQRHAIRNLAAKTAARTGLQVLTLGRGAILGRVAGGMQQLIVQGYRQDQELEADLYGARLARLAGFDARGIIALLERLQAAHPDGRGPLAEVFQYFKSHPPTGVRIEKLRAAL